MKNLLKNIVIDVDGTLTDAGIYYDENGNELKKFCTKDAAGIKAAMVMGIEIIVITGRECAATTRRLSELGVKKIFQNVKNKREFLADYMLKNSIKQEEIGYIGDDLNDLSPMSLTSYIACPADSCKEIIAIANYVSPVCGGKGAVREIIEHYLTENNLWKTAIEKVFNLAGV